MVGAHLFFRRQRGARPLFGGSGGEAAIPLTALALAPTPGLVLRGDAGIISSDAPGLINIARTYWSNKATNLVNDLPSEAWLYPETWGELRFE